jgi:hypothetical protein
VLLQLKQGNMQLNVRRVLILEEIFHSTGKMLPGHFGSAHITAVFLLLTSLSRWLYAVNLMINADFRLKNKVRGIKNNPLLGDGWGHWAPEGPYQAYIQEYGYQTEVHFNSV